MDKSWCYILVSGGFKVKVDCEDVSRIRKHKWRVTVGSRGRMRVVTAIRKNRRYRTITLGKFLLNPPEGKLVHPRRYEDGLDYRKRNLIVCTRKEQQRLLSKRRVECSSSFKGVHQCQISKGWRASIKVDGRSISLGEFSSEVEAALAYNRAARAYFGEFAYLNLIDPSSNRDGQLDLYSHSSGTSSPEHGISHTAIWQTSTQMKLFKRGA